MARTAKPPGVATPPGVITERRRAARPAGKGTLVSVDGISAAAIRQTAKRLAAADRKARAGISWWDASGIFGDVGAAPSDAEQPSVRTLLLLYAADLSFRLRWEIAPALAEGRTVIAAPYVDTAVALGRAAGVDEAWLRAMFDFAPVPAERRYVETVRSVKTETGLLEFTCKRAAGLSSRGAREALLTRMRARLKATRARA
jgi:hypothetical protein